MHRARYLRNNVKWSFQQFNQNPPAFMQLDSVQLIPGKDYPESLDHFALLKQRPFAFSSFLTGSHSLESLLGYRMTSHVNAHLHNVFINKVSPRTVFETYVDLNVPSIHSFNGTNRFINIWASLSDTAAVKTATETLLEESRDSRILHALFAIGMASPDAVRKTLASVGIEVPGNDELKESLKASRPSSIPADSEITEAMISMAIGGYVIQQLMTPNARAVITHSLSALDALSSGGHPLIAPSPGHGMRLVPDAERAVNSIMFSHSFSILCMEAMIAGAHIKSSLDNVVDFERFMNDHPRFRQFLQAWASHTLEYTAEALTSFPNAAEGYARASLFNPPKSEDDAKVILDHLSRKTMLIYPAPVEGDSLTLEELSTLDRKVVYEDMKFGPPNIKRVGQDEVVAAIEQAFYGPTFNYIMAKSCSRYFGANNHDEELSIPAMQRHLERTGLFKSQQEEQHAENCEDIAENMFKEMGDVREIRQRLIESQTHETPK
eukprot:GDKJ01054636.1.p1 GENE.GDKJ01054636.1~~GDKJ01054636.1.p1  ORF type:complete len:493 (+),score=104.48 GDKJ01054636.1:32-1510(+)